MDKTRGSIDLITKEKILKGIDAVVEYSIIMPKTDNLKRQIS